MIFFNNGQNEPMKNVENPSIGRQLAEHVLQPIVVSEQPATVLGLGVFDPLLDFEDPSGDVSSGLDFAVTGLLFDLTSQRLGMTCEEAIVGGRKRLARARIALSGGSADKLAIDASRFLGLGGNHVNAAQLCHSVTEPDVRTSAGHVGGNRHGTELSGTSDDFCFFGILLAVE